MAAAERACSSFMRERSWSRPPESSSIEKREENLIFLMALPEHQRYRCVITKPNCRRCPPQIKKNTLISAIGDAAASISSRWATREASSNFNLLTHVLMTCAVVSSGVLGVWVASSYTHRRAQQQHRTLQANLLINY